MSEVKQHCDTCKHSYQQMAHNTCVSGGVKTQYCASPNYNSDNYTHEMLMEDWDKGYCRFWAPKEERKT